MHRFLRGNLAVESRDVLLVDTSLWVADSVRPGLIAQHVGPETIATCPPIVQELLQGAREHLAVLRTTLLSLLMLESPLDLIVFEEAAEIYRTGRKVGITIRSPFDCLIAACAIRNDVPLLHCDRDFEAIARFTGLQSRYVLP